MRREIAPRRTLRSISLLSIAVAAIMVTVAACGGGKHGGAGNLVFSRVAPDNGAGEGGEKVLVLGSNFGSPASVVFGGVSATSAQVIDANTISCRIPAHA